MNETISEQIGMIDFLLMQIEEDDSEQVEYDEDDDDYD